MLIISCDPGLTGALALIDSGRGLLECADVPTCSNGHDTGSMKRWVDVEGLLQLLRDWSARHSFAGEAVHGVIERPIPMPTLPAQTIASQFDTFGALRAVMAPRFVGNRMHFVNPREWQKFFGLKADKSMSRKACEQLYPSAPVSLVKHHNRAEAILIGHWYRRHKVDGMPRELVYVPQVAVKPAPVAEPTELPF